MIRVEQTLEAGSENWTEHVEREIDACREKDLPTPAEREDCIKPTQIADASVAIAVVAATTALRAYWIGVSIGEDPKALRKHMLDLADAVDDLPVEAFGGLRKMLRR